jgi:predicted MPP superfamily phosphohydrolase
MKRDPDRWLRLWLWALNLAVAAIGLVWAASGSNRRAFFLVLFVPLALGPFSWARLRVHRSLRRQFPRQPWGLAVLAVAGAAGIACDLLMLAQLLMARSPDAAALLQAPGVHWVGAVWFSGHALYLLGSGIAALGRAISAAGRRGWRWYRPATAAAPANAERRLFLKQMGVMSVGAPFALSLSGVPLSYDFRVDERDIHLPHWPRELDGLRVVHLSDIHVGGAMNRERLLRVAELTNAARPDVVVHTGDFLTHRSGDFDLPLYEALARIRAPHGQWACLGNHDYDDATTLVRRLRDAGVVTLRNDLASLEVAGSRLEIAGLDYAWGRDDREATYARALAAWPARESPRLLLNHDPSGFAALPAGGADLVCSGHTHGGHIGVQLGLDQALTVVGLVGIPDQGIFERGDMRLFVTRCVGFYGYPMRLGIPPEIAVLVLRSA